MAVSMEEDTAPILILRGIFLGKEHKSWDNTIIKTYLRILYSNSAKSVKLDASTSDTLCLNPY